MPVLCSKIDGCVDYFVSNFVLRCARSIGDKTVKLIISRLIEEKYIFDVTDKSYQEKRYFQRNEISDPDKFVPMTLTSVEEANMF